MNNNLTKSIAGPISLTQREAVLGISTCAFGAMACLMTGVVLGMLISPRKEITIGSHNGNNNCKSNGCEPETPVEEIGE